MNEEDKFENLPKKKINSKRKRNNKLIKTNMDKSSQNSKTKGK